MRSKGIIDLFSVNSSSDYFIDLIHKITVVTIFFGVVYAGLFLFMGSANYSAVVGVYTVLVSMVFLLNKFNLHLVSRLWYILLVNLGLGFNSVLFGLDTGVHYFYYVSASLPFVIFGPTEKVARVFSVILSIICYSLLQFRIIETHSNLPSNEASVFYYISATTSFAWTMINFLYLARINNRAFDEIKEQNKVINEALNQREVLLKEVHHRVKNNLQIITSLLNIQSDKVGNNEVIKSEFQQISNRVRSIAYVHESLYNSDDFSKIDLRAYIPKIVEELLQLNEQNGNQQSVDYQLDELLLDLERAVPLGLIINEMVTNSIKYGSAQNDLFIKIILSKAEDSFVLTVSDNGRGFDYNALVNNNTSLGLFLIQELTTQIGGEVVCESNGEGTKYMLQFSQTAYL